MIVENEASHKPWHSDCLCDREREKREGEERSDNGISLSNALTKVCVKRERERERDLNWKFFLSQEKGRAHCKVINYLD